TEYTISALEKGSDGTDTLDDIEAHQDSGAGSSDHDRTQPEPGRDLGCRACDRRHPGRLDAPRGDLPAGPVRSSEACRPGTARAHGSRNLLPLQGRLRI